MKKWLIPSLIAAHLLYLQSLSFYLYPELFIYPYLVSKGFVPYLQIFDQHFPPLLMMPINLWNLGMQDDWQAKLVFFALITLTHILLYFIAKKLFAKSSFVFVPNILYVALQPLFDGGTLWIDTFITPVALAAVLCFVEGLGERGIRNKFGMTNVKFWIVGGILLGITFTLKQTSAFFVAAVLTFFILNKNTQKQAVIASMCASIAPFLLLSWVYQKNILDEFLYWTLTFNTDVYAKMAVIYPTLGQIMRVLVVWGIAALLFAWSKIRTKTMVLFAISALSLSFFAFGRFGMGYLQVALPFVVLLISYSLFLGKLAIPGKLQNRIPQINSGIFLFALAILLTLWHGIHISRYPYIGSYLTTGETSKIAEEIKKRVSPDDHIFIFGGNPVLYPMTETIPPGNVYTVLVPWNYVVAQDRILQGLQDDPPKLVVVEEGSQIDGQMGRDFGKEVYNFILESYERTDEIEGYSFYENRN